MRNIKRLPHTKRVKKRRRDGIVQAYWMGRKESKKRKLRGVGTCPICRDIVYDITTKDFLGRLKPLYKSFEGYFYHNSKTKPCWIKFDKSRHKPINSEVGGELSTPSTFPINAKIYTTVRKEH